MAFLSQVKNDYVGRVDIFSRASFRRESAPRHSLAAPIEFGNFRHGSPAICYDFASVASSGPYCFRRRRSDLSSRRPSVKCSGVRAHGIFGSVVITKFGTYRGASARFAAVSAVRAGRMTILRRPSLCPESVSPTSRPNLFPAGSSRPRLPFHASAFSGCTPSRPLIRSNG